MVLDIEYGGFTPLVFSTTGGLGSECQKVFACLAGLISEKGKTEIQDTTTWLHEKFILPFAEQLVFVFVAAVLSVRIGPTSN